MILLHEPHPGICLRELLTEADISGIDCDIKPAADGNFPVLRGIASLRDAGSHEITFFANPKLLGELQKCRAGAVILPSRALEYLPPELPFAAVLTDNPYLLYARLSQWFAAAAEPVRKPSISIHAVVHETAMIEEGVEIGPFAVIEAGVHIRKGCRISAHCYVGPNCVLGSNTRLYPHVTLYSSVKIGERCIIHSQAVIGADGFGNAPDSTREKGAWCKIAQLGSVQIDDDVEIGAGTTIDCGALGDTHIHRGVRIDNLVMIGHNCSIGEHTAIAGCAGIAGSTIIGKRCILGGATMFSGHQTITDDVVVSGSTGIMGDVSKPGTYTSVFPYTEHSVWQKNAPVIKTLAQLRRRVQHLEKQGKNN